MNLNNLLKFHHIIVTFIYQGTAEFPWIYDDESSIILLLFLMVPQHSGQGSANGRNSEFLSL